MEKTLTVRIGGEDIGISMRCILKKELRPLAIALARRIDEASELLGGGGFVKMLPEFLSKNLDFICRELVLPFTNLTPGQIEEMAVADIIRLLGLLLEYNAIPANKIINFFAAAVPDPKTGQTAPASGFGGTAVPSHS